LLDSLMNVAMKYRDRIDGAVMMPRVNWRQPSNERRTQTHPKAMALSEATLGVMSNAGKNGGSPSAKKTRVG
jgi:hypothetical protein